MVTPVAKSLAVTGTGPSLQAAVPKMSLGSSSILFVDDDGAFSYAAAKALRAAGYEVWLAPDHLVALQILEAPSPSIS
jgi:ActR/RegA family two-component response regulator